jgi:hypothetical protein
MEMINRSSILSLLVGQGKRQKEVRSSGEGEGDIEPKGGKTWICMYRGNNMIFPRIKA